MDWWRVVRVLMIISAGVLAHIAIIQREKIAIMRRDLKIALKAYNILWKMYHEKIEQERESRMNYEKEIKKLEAQIKELKQKIEAEKEAPPVWQPDHREEYFTVDGDRVEGFRWIDDFMDKASLALGEVFRTKEAAEAHLRALRLIETIRRERFKAQGKWWPSEDELRYIVRWYQPDKSVGITHSIWSFFSSVFGLWQDSGALIDVIEKHEPELKWYFTEYLPSIN